MTALVPFIYVQSHSQSTADLRAQHEHTTFVGTFVQYVETTRGVWHAHSPRKFWNFGLPRSVLVQF